MSNIDPQVDVSGLRNLVRAAMFSAMTVGAGFALVVVPNVELVTLMIFISGLALGFRWGIIVGGVSEFIFSVLNPVGSGLMFPPLLISQVLSMMIIGGIGGLLRYWFWRSHFSMKYIVGAGITGVVLTFIFDTLTSLSYPISAGFAWKETLAIYIQGMMFLIVHHVSNGIVFLVGIPLVVPRIYAFHK